MVSRLSNSCIVEDTDYTYAVAKDDCCQKVLEQLSTMVYRSWKAVVAGC